MLSTIDGWTFHSWDCIRGIRLAARPQVLDEIRDPVAAIESLKDHQDTVLIAHNLHLFLDIPEVIQAIQNGVTKWKASGCCLVMVSPLISMKPEIDKIFTVLDLPLPDEEALLRLQGELANSMNVPVNPASVRAAKGLIEFEAETAFALSLIKERCFSTAVISQAKAQMIRKSQLMEFWEPTEIADVGGLENLKTYIQNRAKAFDSTNLHLPRPKGILLVGIPGTGKSLSCKATASILGWPLIRLDIGALKNSLVGESERRMRQATQLIDAFGEAVIWCDEVEKVFSGSRSSGETDAGTTASMFAHFLTWMSETKSPILVMATANDISKLPPEFIRAGRFDGIFFVDLPTGSERKEILGIMNRKYKTEIPSVFSEKLVGFTGAEIEQLVKDSLFDGLSEAFSAIVPLSKVMREEINSLRDWAKTRARLANSPEETVSDQRKIRKLNQSR
jgi:SpoVK/Ycf46/Vps4 family AAA+-type ATPase